VPGNSTLVLEDWRRSARAGACGVIGQFFEPPPTVRSVVDRCVKAKVDRRVLSVIIRPTSAAALWGKVQKSSMRSWIFGARENRLSAISNTAGEQEFYLASACDKVFLMPAASLDLTGMASYELFLRAPSKIGAYPTTSHIGEYKTAVQHVHRAHVYARAS